MPAARRTATLSLLALTLLTGRAAPAQVTDYLVVGESVIDFDGQVVTRQNAASGVAIIDESTPGTPELTALDLLVEWTSTFAATTYTGCAGSTVTMASTQILSPDLPQSGTGDSDSSISWGALTGWSSSGRLYCETQAPQGCGSACVQFVGFEGTGPPLPLASNGFDSDPWQFVGPGSPKTAFLTEPMRITDGLGFLDLTQDIDLLGITSTLVSLTPTTFCVVGLSTGTDWSWQIDSEGINDVANPGAGSSDADLAQAFADSIDLGSMPSGASAAVVPGFPSCFTVSYTQPFQLFVGPQGSTPCLVSGNPQGCQFNPLLIERRFLHEVPLAPWLLLGGAAASVLAVGGAAARRRPGR